ncbi:trimeric intracellular cation channel family protein [Erythrobacter sp. HKB08]|uniref:trimeric intracellular cation channel family protein n=1 Tax=Erythrobacter sp. HKB08 TaxID=2502843 RepID=UPI00100935A9|nr:trimeric intracellular cation channel family protein [Erythrobacter sp. HKB08]
MDEIIPTPVLDALDVLGVAVFALSGALLAAKERQTFVTMAFFALVTGVGGGTIRDLLIDAPVFWISDPWIAAVCLATALIAWFTPTRWWEGRLLDYSDGLGLTAYAVLGSAKALSYGVPPVPAILMGIITGCVGGIIRDVVAGRPSIIMRPELYVTAAALSATLNVLGSFLPLQDWLVWTIATAAGLVLRSAAIRFNLALPSYREGRKGLEIEEVAVLTEEELETGQPSKSSSSS